MNPKHVIKFVSRGFIAIAPITFLILFTGCESSHQEDDKKLLQARVDSLSERIVFLDSTISELTKTADSSKKIPEGPSQCQDVFPGSNEVSFLFEEISPMTNDTKVYEVNLEEDCLYNLESFSKCCRCSCSVDYLIVDGPVSDGDILTVSLSGSSQRNFTNQDLTITDGKISLTSYGFSREWEAGMTFTVKNPNGNMDGISCVGGGLCVVVAVEGGGN